MTERMRLLSYLLYDLVGAIQGSQICQIWRILCQNCSDDSPEVTEGVTSTPKIFGKPLRLQKFSVTNTVLCLPFSQQIQFTIRVSVVNVN